MLCTSVAMQVRFCIAASCDAKTVKFFLSHVTIPLCIDPDQTLRRAVYLKPCTHDGLVLHCVESELSVSTHEN